jgi:Ca2+-binding EF-hand superfamily protein
LFQAFDVDGDGNISFEEACNGIYSLLEGNSEAALRMRFRSIDLDRSGFIDLGEAKALGTSTLFFFFFVIFASVINQFRW